MSGKSWYESGYQGGEREQEKRDLGNAPRRHWMVPAKTMQGVFVDDVPFCTHEHQWKTGDSKFPQFGTCVSKISADGSCTGCTSKGVQKAEYTGHLTMVDASGYVTKDGKEVKYELVEFCPKLKVQNKLKLKKQTKGTFVGYLCSVTRTDKEAPNTGDDFDFLREVKMEELYKLVTYKGKNISDLISKANSTGEEALKVRRYLAHHFQIPAEGEIPARIPVFNYANIHAPMEPGEFKTAVAGAVGYTGNNDRVASGGVGGTADDNVPF